MLLSCPFLGLPQLFPSPLRHSCAAAVSLHNVCAPLCPCAPSTVGASLSKNIRASVASGALAGVRCARLCQVHDDVLPCGQAVRLSARVACFSERDATAFPAPSTETKTRPRPCPYAARLIESTSPAG
ncbi:hypothetical protein TRVL_07299 [Trypanosoma vivax]|nr:hypothetical protein TRVL_07299 [Trypanosoma vivax]